MSTLKEKYCNDDTREGMELTEDEVLEYYNSREWIFGDSEENADLETARIAVERELRERNMILSSHSVKLILRWTGTWRM